MKITSQSQNLINDIETDLVYLRKVIKSNSMKFGIEPKQYINIALAGNTRIKNFIQKYIVDESFTSTDIYIALRTNRKKWIQYISKPIFERIITFSPENDKAIENVKHEYFLAKEISIILHCTGGDLGKKTFSKGTKIYFEYEVKREAKLPKMTVFKLPNGSLFPLYEQEFIIQ